ncbi:uncharacterized protein LOC123653323 [Pipistrellus kuhlii]|uniref:uncharacterized protein LOC123653323 n=1 Tax=Pipistrellus kuhlii TaxID=59472 RepID=UPI001E270B02|nr:uncharacterized protein LOC123653323 [Pipistrellus kuhlii]
MCTVVCTLVRLGLGQQHVGTGAPQTSCHPHQETDLERGESCVKAATRKEKPRSWSACSTEPPNPPGTRTRSGLLFRSLPPCSWRQQLKQHTILLLVLFLWPDQDKNVCNVLKTTLWLSRDNGGWDIKCEAWDTFQPWLLPS